MAVSNGQKVDQTVTNAAFLSRLQDSDTIGKQGFLNTDVESGADILNIQRAVNETFDAVGMTGEGDATRKNYSTNNILANGDSHKVALGKVDAKFDPTSGHKHKGIAGDGPKIDAADLANINLLYAEFQAVSKTGVSGLTVNLNTEFVGRLSGGSETTTGVITTYPLNKIFIIDSSTNTFLEDANGQRIFGYLNYTAFNWILSFYTNEAGVETAHNLALADITIIFREVFTQFTRPTIPSNPLQFGTLDVTADVVDASQSQRGLMSTLAQTFAGIKTWVNTTQATASNLAGQIFSGGVGIAKKLWVGEQIISDTFNGVTAKALASSVAKEIIEATTTLAELNLVAGVTSAIQAQIDLKTDVNNKTETIAALGSFTRPTKYLENYYVAGDTAPRDASATPFGGLAPIWDGAEVAIVGSSDTNPVTITHNDAAFGVLCGIDIVLYRGSGLKLKWIAAAQRYFVVGRFELGV
jgi:hypothetical protein